MKRPVTLKKNHKFPARPIMDIPTTDPGLDLCYSNTSDEDYETDGDIFGRGCKGKLLRRSPQLIGDTNVLMPPELIITSAKKTDDELGADKSGKVSEAMAQSISEFPPINTSKRAKSWHNFNRCMATLKITNPTQDVLSYDAAESLQLKLSLKKQIWAGAWPGNGIDRSRPLSWGVSSISGKKSMGAAHPRMHDYDSESLLTACSQKLAAWQESERQNAASTVASDKKTPRKQASVNVGALQGKSLGGEKATKPRKGTATVTPTKSLPEEQGKTKRKPKSSLTKIVKATDFFTHLTKSSSKTPKSRDVPSSAALLVPPTPGSAFAPNANHKSPSKFRTGAIVVTAVQPGKKSKKLRPPPRRRNHHDTSDTDSDNAKTFVRKVRTKIKRKKSKSTKEKH